MFLGHIALGLGARRAMPRVPLATWFVAVQFVDLLWPIFLLAGLEHVRIAPGITAFTPLEFYDYPITHSLVGGLGWGLVLAAICRAAGLRSSDAIVVGGAVLTHWILDVISHRPDMPVLPHGPYLGLGLWNSVAATLIVELSMFAAGIWLYARGRQPRLSFWLLMLFLLAAYFAAAFGPPPPNPTALAWTALTMWVLVPWFRWVERR